ENARAAARRVNEAREHLEGGRLAGAVGAEEANHLARLDGKTDVLDGVDFLVVATEQARQGAAKAGGFLKDTIGFGQAPGFDDRHCGRLSAPAEASRVIVALPLLPDQGRGLTRFGDDDQTSDALEIGRVVRDEGSTLNQGCGGDPWVFAGNGLAAALVA